MLIRDVLTILLTMALFVFALAPRDHAHGPRRREGDSVSSIQALHQEYGRRFQYEAEALEDVELQTAFGASR